MEQLGSFLPGFLRSVAKDEETALTFLDALWPEIVGQRLAAQCRPVSLKEETLTVMVQTETWRNELMAMKSLMISAVKKFWGMQLVETIHFEVPLTDL